MHGDQVRAVGLALFGHLHAGQVFGVPADAHLHRQGGILAQGAAGCSDHPSAEGWVQQQLTARTAVGDFGRGAAHVDVQNIKPDALFPHQQNGLFQGFRLTAEQLNSVQPVGVGIFEQRKGLLVVKVQGLSAGHLADGPGCTVVGHQVAAGSVGQARHRGKHRPRRDLQIA